MPDTTPEVPSTKPTHRCRVSNGSALLVDVDGRSVWARRMRDLIEAHIGDLGGVEACSHAERSIVRRVAAITVELEAMESEFATTEGATEAARLDLYQRTANSLRRLLEAVGLERRSRDITPPLRSYIEGSAQ